VFGIKGTDMRTSHRQRRVLPPADDLQWDETGHRRALTEHSIDIPPPAVDLSAFSKRAGAELAHTDLLHSDSSSQSDRRCRNVLGAVAIHPIDTDAPAVDLALLRDRASVERGVAMTDRAKALGCRNTHWRWTAGTQPIAQLPTQAESPAVRLTAGGKTAGISLAQTQHIELHSCGNRQRC
jgi:hypothetical protein